jgi:hypothetical protein
MQPARAETYSMRTSYGVVWREGAQPLARGKLELLPRGLKLDGLAGSDRITRELAYDELAAVHVGRSSAERLDGHATLVLEPAGGDLISLAAVAQPGVIGELAERLAELRLDTSRKTAIVVPLKDGSREAAQTLLDTGPPFDPTLTELERHEVFLGEREAIFVFDSPIGIESLQPLLEDAEVWRGLAAWGELLDGPPRFAEAAFTWSKP